MRVLKAVIGMILWLFLTKSYAFSRADSLERLMNQLPHNKQYVAVVNQYLWYLFNSRDDETKAEKLLQTTEKLAIKLKDYNGLQRLYWYHGRLYSRRERQQIALVYLKKAYYLIEKHKLSVSERQRTLAELGVVYYYINQFERALKYLLEAIELTERYHLNDHITEAYRVTGRIMYSINRQKSFQYAQKSLTVAYRDQDSTSRYLAELFISSFYTQKNELAKALNHSQKALYWAEKYCRKSTHVSCWTNLAVIHNDMNQKDSALYYFKKAEFLAENLNDINRKNELYLSLGYFYYKEKNYSLAEKYFLQTLKLAEKIGDAPIAQEALKLLTEVYARTHNYQKAFHFQAKSLALEDSLFSKNLAMKVRDLTDKIEKEKRETAMKLLKTEKQNAIFQRNMFLLVGGLTFFLGFLSILFVINRAKYRRLQESLQLRNKIAADLHDEIGSTLSSISLLSGLTQKQLAANQPQKAEQMVDKISSDARQMLESMDDIVWTINPRNDSMQHLFTRLREYAKPLAESKEIELEFVTDAQVESLSLPLQVRQNVYLIVKEALNNAFKYAQASKISVEFRGQNDEWSVAVVDNGLGFDVAVVNSRNGLKNMKKRAEEMGGALVIESVLQKGSAVRLNLKN